MGLELARSRRTYVELEQKLSELSKKHWRKTFSFVSFTQFWQQPRLNTVIRDRESPSLYIQLLFGGLRYSTEQQQVSHIGLLLVSVLWNGSRLLCHIQRLWCCFCPPRWKQTNIKMIRVYRWKRPALKQVWRLCLRQEHFLVPLRLSNMYTNHCACARHEPPFFDELKLRSSCTVCVLMTTVGYSVTQRHFEGISSS